MRRSVLIAAAAVVIVLVVGLVVVSLELQSPPPELPPLPAASPAPPFYLPYPTGAKENSSILVLAESVSYTSYPFESVPKTGSYPAVNKGDPCIRINATVRSDYSQQNKVPGQDMLGNNNTVAFVYLSAEIFNAQGEVQATDVTPDYPGVPVSGLFLQMSPGEVDDIAIYLVTSHTNYTSYKIVIHAIAATPIP